MPATPYQCPGQDQPISRSIHLGRLARFYPECRACPHRDDTATLSTKLVARLIETRRRARASDLFYEEGLAGVELNQLDPRTVRRAASAFGVHLKYATAPADEAPIVVIAGDGRPLAAELVEAAAEGLRRAGCAVVDIGSAASGCVTAAIAELGAGGALLVGNAPSRTHTVGLKFWGPAGRPLSSGGELDAIRERFRSGVSRPVRSFPSLRRFQAEAPYLARLEPSFHALRPLRVQLATTCAPLKRYLEKLAAEVACEFVPQSTGTPAHFGIWIDGDGEACRVHAEQGRPIPGEHVLALLAEHLLNNEPGRAVVVEEAAPSPIDERIAELGGRVVRSGAKRAEMDHAMRDSGAIVGGGPSGRFWFAGRVPSADALEVLARLLVILSESDRPLSEAINRAIFTPRCSPIQNPKSKIQNR